MEIEEILRELDTIFRDILKKRKHHVNYRDHGKRRGRLGFTDEYAPHHGHRKTLQHSFRPA